MHILQCPAQEFFHTGTVYNVTDVFFAAWCVGVNVFLHIVIGVEDDFYDALLISPLDNVDTHSGIFSAGSPQQGKPVVFLLTAGPGTVGAVDDTFAAGNDANVAALGECWKGGGQGCQNMAMVTLGTGIGGGIIVDGKMVTGAHGAGGEIGHMVLETEETEFCGCGKQGCAEQYCSATGIVRVAKQVLASAPMDSSLRKMNTLTCKDVFDSAACADALALEILERVYAYLGRFLANVCCVADPDVIVLGGGVSKAGTPLLEGAMRYYQKYAFHACREVKLVPARLGNDAGAYGAYKLILDTQAV